MSLLIEQCLNGLQLGILLFLISAGLTLVFGIMNFVNLAHGSLFMLGAFVTAWLTPLQARATTSSSRRSWPGMSPSTRCCSTR